MTQRMVSIGNDFWIENERGEKVYKVDGKALRVRQTLIFEDRGGKELCKIQERMFTSEDSMEIEDTEAHVAMVKKALITPVREQMDRRSTSGDPDLEIQGNILDHEYKSSMGASASPKFPRSGLASAILTAWRSIRGRMMF